MASARRTTGAEWKRRPISSPVASAWWVPAANRVEGSYFTAVPPVNSRFALNLRMMRGSTVPSRSSWVVGADMMRDHSWSVSTRRLASVRRSLE